MEKMYIVVAINGYTAAGVLDNGVLSDESMTAGEKLAAAVDLIAQTLIEKLETDKVIQ